MKFLPYVIDVIVLGISGIIMLTLAPQGIDWSKAITAMFLACVSCLGEMVSKNESKVLQQILNRYTGYYLALNVVASYVTYCMLPAIAPMVLQPDQLGWASKETWPRTFVAAFGYMVIVRTKFVTIKEYPIGIESVYKAFSDYCLRHSQRLIRIRLDRELDEIVVKFPRLQTYDFAIDDQKSNAQEVDRLKITSQYDSIKASSLAEKIKCKRIAELLYGIVGTKEEVIRVLKNAPELSVP